MVESGQLTCTNGKDAKTLPNMFKNQFIATAAGLKQLVLGHFPVTEASRLARAVYYFPLVESIALSHGLKHSDSSLVEAAVGAICDALRNGAVPALEPLFLNNTGVNDAALRDSIVPMCQARPKIYVYIQNCNISRSAKDAANVAVKEAHRRGRRSGFLMPTFGSIPSIRNY